MAKRTTAPAKRGSGAVAPDYGDHHQGGGYENTTQQDFAVPFLTLLQSNSPQVEEGDCKAGNWYNTVTEQEYTAKNPVTLIPCATEHLFVEWVPRDSGGGFVAVHAIDSDVVRKAKAESDKFGKYKTPEGNDLVETFYWYCMVVPEGGLEAEPEEFVIVAFKSTGIKCHKRIMGRWRMTKGRPPLYANTVQLGSDKVKNDQGTFYVPTATPPVDGDVIKSLIPPMLGKEEHPMLAAAVEFNKQVREGLARADYSTAQQDDPPTDGKAPF